METLRRKNTMKFNHGGWMLLPGTQATYPISVVDVQVEERALVIIGYSKATRSRSETVEGTIITLRFSSPIKNVIRVEITHHKGRKGRLPVFDLEYNLSNASAEAGKDEKTAWLNAGSLSVRVALEGEWNYTFLRDGQTLTESSSQTLSVMTQNEETYLREQLSLQAGEKVYGMGEHFGPLVKNGQSIDMWNEDGGTSSEQAYKNIPFYMTDRGYGVLVNHPGRVSFEAASHHASRVQFSVVGHSMDYTIFGGPTPKEVLEQYTALSGRPALPPEWSFGLWLSTSFTTNYDENAILKNIEKMEANGIPVSVIHFDCYWMKRLTWCSFLWDRQYFPDPEGMIQRIHEKGVKVCLWINPYIAEASPLFDEGAASGFLLEKENGDIYQVDKWQPGMGIVDFTNPKARDWYTSKLKKLVQMGVDAFKTDFGERIPEEVHWHDRSDPARMHNYYSYLYNQSVFELLEQVKGKGEAAVFARAATCGGQKFPVHWGGDCVSSYASMAETLRGGLSLGLSGFGFWSHDISGFIGTASPDLYKRWVAFGMLSSHSRLHGMDSPRMPWNFDAEAVEVLRFFAALKKQLMPYLLDMAREAHEHGWPMLRAMALEFPQDPACAYLDLQYMLGNALLVAPIFDDSGAVEYYLPQGEWRNLLTGEIAEGPAWKKEKHDYFSLPLWVNSTTAEKWQCLKRFEIIRHGNSGNIEK
jgi:alpha-D-xyloside xylohydrolase